MNVLRESPIKEFIRPSKDGLGHIINLAFQNFMRNKYYILVFIIENTHTKTVEQK